jgi:hypothetical protein
VVQLFGAVGRVVQDVWSGGACRDWQSAPCRCVPACPPNWLAIEPVGQRASAAECLGNDSVQGRAEIRVVSRPCTTIRRHRQPDRQGMGALKFERDIALRRRHLTLHVKHSQDILYRRDWAVPFATIAAQQHSLEVCSHSSCGRPLPGSDLAVTSVDTYCSNIQQLFWRLPCLSHAGQDAADCLAHQGACLLS